MKVLLDENITQKSIPILEKYGHDVIHVLDRFNAGKSDEDVFQLALKEQRALITLNGKDLTVITVKEYGNVTSFAVESDDSVNVKEALEKAKAWTKTLPPLPDQ